MPTMTYRLLCGPMANKIVALETPVAELKLLRNPKPLTLKSVRLSPISIKDTVQVSCYRYIRHKFEWGKDFAYVYAWEYASNKEILEALTSPRLTKDTPSTVDTIRKLVEAVGNANGTDPCPMFYEALRLGLEWLKVHTDEKDTN